MLLGLLFDIRLQWHYERLRSMALPSPFSSPTIKTNPCGSSRVPTPSSVSHHHHFLTCPTGGEPSPHRKKSHSLVVLGHRQGQPLIENCILRDRKCLRELSSWGIGGPCRYFLRTSRASQLVAAVRWVVISSNRMCRAVGGSSRTHFSPLLQVLQGEVHSVPGPRQRL